MNFAFLPSSSLLSHSSSDISVAPGASSHTMVSRRVDAVSVNRGVCRDYCRSLPIYLATRPEEIVRLTQVWAANSLSRSASYFLFISSSETSARAPEGLNFQSHSEQPKPWKF